MGIVYKARQESLGRFVALKVLPSFAGMEPSAVARFRREAEAAGRLSHPGIVPVYGVGEVNGIHYYAMELVEGPTLGGLIDRLRGRTPGRLLGSLAEETGIDKTYPALKNPPGAEVAGTRYARSCAALAADIADALATAHEGKIIHRDLKPSNVMIHRTGRPVLLDFGLARDEMAVGLTRSGDAVGTPSYMAPEQACGRKDLDARVDIYGLGALLYELLALRPPFEGGHAGEIMRRILDEEPAPLRKLNPRVPADLETIVNTCLAKDPDRRYAAIEAFELDLRAFLAGRPVTARPPSARQRASRFFRHNQRVVVAAAVTLVIAVGAGVTAGVIAKGKAVERGRAALADARHALLERHNALEAQTALASAASLLEAGDVSRARTALAKDAFMLFYPKADYELLRSFFDGLSDAERGALREEVERVAGRGVLRIGFAAEGDRDGARSELQALVGLRLAGPRPTSSGARLCVGDYLLRVAAPGRAPFVRSLRVERDRETLVPVVLPPADAFPDGMVQVVDPLDDERVAVSTTELSRAQYQSFLAGLGDEALRLDMLPDGWVAVSGDDGLLPVTGLSFRQARAAAAYLGCHLLSRREYDLAATAGLPLEFPWGGDLDEGRVVADPDERSGPEPVISALRGASVLGVLNLLGNAAEILAPARDGVPWLAGGDFQTAPSALKLDNPKLHKALRSPGESKASAGTRLAKFLAPRDHVEVHKRVEQRRDEVANGAAAALLHDWIVGEGGAISYAIQLTGVHTSDGREMTVPLTTTGFQQMGEPTVRDGHGTVLDIVPVLASHLEASQLAIRTKVPFQRGHGYRLNIATWLRSVEGLVGEGDGYVLRLPVKATGMQAIVHRVQLPTHCRIEEVDPSPTQRYHLDGHWHLVWEFAADLRGRRAMPAEVRFRRDGAMTEDWPAEQELDSRRRELFAALAGFGGSAPVGDLLDPSFLLAPCALDVDGVRHSALAQGFMRDFAEERIRIVDYGAVGPVVTVDLEATWAARVGRMPREVQGWALRLQLLRGNDQYRALRLSLRGRPDLGRLADDGCYRHDDLNVEVRPLKKGTLTRTHDELVELQVMLVHPDDELVKVQVLGCRDAPDADLRPESSAEVATAWLTAGAESLRPGEPIADRQPFALGDAAQRLEPTSQQGWLFGEAGGDWVRERWTLVHRGTRHFLVKCLAKGVGHSRDANARFERHRAWFDEVARGVTIR